MLFLTMNFSGMIKDNIPIAKLNINTAIVRTTAISNPIPPNVITKSWGFINAEAAINVTSGAICTLLLYNSITTGIVPKVQSGDTMPITDADNTDLTGDFETQIYIFLVHEVNFKSSPKNIPAKKYGKKFISILQHVISKNGIVSKIQLK